MFQNQMTRDDVAERLLELGGSVKQKTKSAVSGGISKTLNSTFELAAKSLGGAGDSNKEKGSGANHDPIPEHLLQSHQKGKDDAQLAQVRAQLQTLQGNGQTGEKTNTQTENISFFRRYKQKEEEYFERKKREHEQKKQQKEREELEAQKKREQEKEQEIQKETPKGKIKKHLFGKVKKRASMIETKASAGKQ